MDTQNKPPQISIRRGFYFTEHHTERAKQWLIGGGIVSLVGYLLPWFKFDDRAQWWYGGLSLMTNEGVSGLWIIIVLYLLLFATTFWKETPPALTVILAITVILAPFVVISISAGDALQNVRTINQLVWGVGLFVMLPGSAALLWGAIYRAVIPIIHESLSDIELNVNDKQPW